VSADSARNAICTKVASILRAERLKKGLSMNALAERAGLSQQSVSYIEREMRVPNLDTLLRITAVLKIDLEVIIAQARKEASASAK
jgi:transcriptional regulator with XRE-family HTH domain